MKKQKWKHQAPLVCFIRHKILKKHCESKMTFGTGCDYIQKSRIQCNDCKHNLRQKEWEDKNSG